MACHPKRDRIFTEAETRHDDIDLELARSDQSRKSDGLPRPFRSLRNRIRQRGTMGLASIRAPIPSLDLERYCRLRAAIDSPSRAIRNARLRTALRRRIADLPGRCEASRQSGPKPGH